jgi:hypothetical protein
MTAARHCQCALELGSETELIAQAWVKPELGCGNYWRVSHEFLLLVVRGNLPFADHCQKSWLEASRMEHKRGADTTDAMDCSQRGLAGDYEDDPDLDREGYREIIELLQSLGIEK